MTERAPDRFWSSIDIPKTVAGVLAAVSAAVVGSFLGVAGTLIGAAVASIIGSIGTEIYHRLVARGQQKIKATFVTAPAAVGTPPVAAAEDESPSEPEPATAPSPPRQIRWSRVILVAGGLFVLAMGSLTAFELIAGKSVPAAVGNKASCGTTVCSVVKGSSEERAPARPPSSTAPSTNEPAEPTGTPSETPATPEPTAPSSEPSTTETNGPTATSTPEPTDVPTTTEAPTLDDRNTSTEAPTVDKLDVATESANETE